jgi:hypothetical protein
MSAAGTVEEGTIREHVLKAGQCGTPSCTRSLDREWHSVP